MHGFGQDQVVGQRDPMGNHKQHGLLPSQLVALYKWMVKSPSLKTTPTQLNEHKEVT